MSCYIMACLYAVWFAGLDQETGVLDGELVRRQTLFSIVLSCTPCPVIIMACPYAVWFAGLDQETGVLDGEV